MLIYREDVAAETQKEKLIFEEKKAELQSQIEKVLCVMFGMNVITQNIV